MKGIDEKRNLFYTYKDKFYKKEWRVIEVVITSCTRNAVVHYGRVGSNPTLSAKKFSLQMVLLFVDFFLDFVENDLGEIWLDFWKEIRLNLSE